METIKVKYKKRIMTTHLFQVKEGSTKPPKTQYKVFREKIIQDRRKDIKKYPKGH